MINPLHAVKLKNLNLLKSKIQITIFMAKAECSFPVMMVWLPGNTGQRCADWLAVKTEKKKDQMTGGVLRVSGRSSVGLSLDESGEHGEGSDWFVCRNHVTRTLQKALKGSHDQQQSSAQHKQRHHRCCLPWQWEKQCCQTLWRSLRPADRLHARRATDVSEPPPDGQMRSALSF